jgi:hypothetical protein
MSHPQRWMAGTLGVLLGILVAGPASAQTLSRNRNPRSPKAVDVVRLPPGPVAISQSVSFFIADGNSLSCEMGGFHTENSYYRAFTLSAMNPPLDSVQFMVERVDIGVELADDGTGAGQPLTLRLHNSSTNPPTLGSLVLLSTTDFTIPDQSLTLLSLFPAVPPVLINATDILVVEILTPDGTAAGNNFVIGSNPNGQTAPSYIRAPACGINEITDLAVVGAPFMHIVMNVLGNNQVPVELQTFEVR